MHELIPRVCPMCGALTMRPKWTDRRRKCDACKQASLARMAERRRRAQAYAELKALRISDEIQ
jgi:hypothetical protein